MPAVTRCQPLRLPRIALAVLLAVGWTVVVAQGAAADGPTTFANTAAIAIPATGSADQRGAASPYPSDITVSGMTGTVSNVTVTFSGLSHGSLGDVDALVVAPTGENLIVLSDLGDPSQLTTANNINLTFSDAAASTVPAVVTVPSGTYKPTNTNPGGATDSFPAPAPTPSSQTTLAGAFTGINPNGTWKLFIVDDAQGDVGTMSGGWSLSVTTQSDAVATTTSVTTSGTPSTTGSAVTFTAHVTAGGSPVTSGTVQFSDGGTNLGSPIALDGSGNAALTTSALAEGTHLIRATYNGATGFLTSNGTVTQRVDNPTVVTGNTYCNQGVMTIPSVGVGAAIPYPSNVTVSGRSGTVSKVTATLKGLSHSAPIDYDILLAGPTPTTNLILMSDAGGQNPVSGIDVTFDDAAAGPVPAPLVSGTYRPTNIASDLPDVFPAPAPAQSGATALSTFNGGPANGTWSLWVVDDATGDTGSIAGGWCLTVSTQAATTTALTSSVNPSNVGQSVTFTATVTSGGTPVTSGTVQFADGGTTLGSPVPVDASGVATLTTSALAEGTHPITATLAASTDYLGSSGSVSQVVQRQATATALTSSLNPSAVGDPVTFTATVTAGGSPVGTGTVQFSDGGTNLGAPVAVDASGGATFTTSALAAGTHPITATYGGTAALAGSTGNLSQAVDLTATTTDLTSSLNPSFVGDSVIFTATVTAGGTPVTTGTVRFGDGGTVLGTFNVNASGIATLTTDTLTAGTHPITASFVATPALAGSSDAVDQVVQKSATVTVLTSNNNPSIAGDPITFTATVTAGGTPVTTGVVTFNDGVDHPIPVNSSGVATLTTDTLSPGTRTITAGYGGTVALAASSDSLEQVVQFVPTTTALTSTQSPSFAGDSVTFTATVTSRGTPVTTGTVQFSDDGTDLGTPVPVNASGIATLTTDTLTAGTHPITAGFSGGAVSVLAASSDNLDQVVRPLPVADVGGPYTVAEGGSLTLDGSGSTDATEYAWDLNGDGDFTDATGAAPTLTWAQLEALGINDGPGSFTVTLRVTSDTKTAEATADLTVTNTAPTVVLTGSTTATAGVPFTIKVGADDPSSADMAATFTYTIEWGDGSAVETVTGPADPPVTHTYTSPGSYAATFAATDKDGGASGPGGPGSVTIVVAAAPTTPTTSAPTTTTTVTSGPSTSEPTTTASTGSSGTGGTSTGTSATATSFTGSATSDSPVPTTGSTGSSTSANLPTSTSSAGGLASTGAAVGSGTIGLGALLVGAGVVLVAAGRRRARGQHR